MELEMVANVLVSVAAVGAVALLLRLYNSLVKKPEEVRRRLAKQGLTGPPQTALIGNIWEVKKSWSAASAKSPALAAGTPPFTHDYADRLMPFLVEWREKYGKLFMFSLGTNKQVIHVASPDMVKEITHNMSVDLGRPIYHAKEMGPLFGDGIHSSNGPKWQYQKKTLGPELHMDKVKGMTTIIYQSAAILLESWKSKVDVAGVVADIQVNQDLFDFSGDVISRACFGSNYEEGKEIFCKLNELKEAMARRIFSIGLPGMTYLPTKNNRDIRRLVKEVDTLILKVVKERKESNYPHKDLLQTVLVGADNGNFSREEKERFIIDNCKNIYLAAQGSIAITTAWCLVLLSSNPEWQDRVRAEVLEIWGGKAPDYEMLCKAKQLTMVLQETLRLYPPGHALSREALKDLNIGGILVPKGVNLWTMVAKLHTDPETWGPDSYTFRPERFANGISGACKLPQSYLPFGFGPRICPGQNLALLELKMVVGLLLSNFSFSLSPDYIHAPIMKLVIEPKYGTNLLVKKL
ncbi:hypothetical protein NMG60_11034368 [Bertholletia excelsa]